MDREKYAAEREKRSRKQQPKVIREEIEVRKISSAQGAEAGVKCEGNVKG